jgi:DNA (cytosine-5)-methyltransferase 1
MSFIEVCGGAGGLSTGFIRAGFKPLLINEIDKDAVATLKANHPAAPIVEGSMLELDLKPFRGVTDLLIGGVPCQAFSAAGKRRGLDDPRGQLVTHFNKLILDCVPRLFVVENVKGLLTHNNGETLQSIIRLFANDGLYRVYYKVLNANNYNVPQKRERLIIVGVHQSIEKDFTYPEPKGSKVLRDVLVNVPQSVGAVYSDAKRAVLDLVPAGGCWIDLPVEIQRTYLGNMMNTSGGKRGIARRLSLDEPSLTLTTSPQQKQTERCHPTETRPLTVREYARIQTFPDDYVFKGSMMKQYKQIGNAVPVLLAFELGNHIKRFLS